MTYHQFLQLVCRTASTTTGPMTLETYDKALVLTLKRLNQPLYGRACLEVGKIDMVTKKVQFTTPALLRYLEHKWDTHLQPPNPQKAPQ